MPRPSPPLGLHLPTLLALAVIAYATAILGHELVGHGGAAVLAGGRPLVVSLASFAADTRGLSSAADRLIVAGGTLGNLLVGLLALGALRLVRPSSGAAYYLLWLVAVVNLFRAFGGLALAVMGGIGDWREIVSAAGRPTVLKLGLVLVGIAGYAAALAAGVRTLEPLLGREQGERASRAGWLCLTPYLAGGVMFPLLALLDPRGGDAALSLALAFLGGCVWLAWLPSWVSARARGDAGTLDVPAHRGYMAAGIATALLCAFVLAPSVPIGTMAAAPATAEAR